MNEKIELIFCKNDKERLNTMVEILRAKDREYGNADSWTMDGVAYVALLKGLEQMEKQYLPKDK